MKKLLVVAAIVGAIGATAFADETSDFKKFHAAAEAKFDAAFHAKNIKYFEEMCAPDFKMTENGRTENRAQTLRSLRQMFAMADVIVVKSKPVKVSAKGGKASAEVTSQMTLTLKPGPDKKVHKMASTGTQTETWVKTSKGWKVASIVTKNSKYTMDGKPFDPSKMSSGGR